MKRGVWVIAILIAGCTDPATTAEEAKAELASEMGELSADVDFTAIHVREDAVCGYADGKPFYSIDAAGGRISTMVGKDAPPTIKGIIEKGFATCMNEGEVLQ